mgnify:CR=1 FL=1
MKKASISKLMRIDMKRAIVSYKFFCSILLGTAICYFTLIFCGNYKSETIHKFIMIHDRSQSFLAYIVGIIPYALSFYDDFLYGNIKNVMGRVSIKDYVFSKTVVAVFSTIIAFIFGKLCFVIVYSIDTPICLPETLDRIPFSIMYIDLIKDGHYISYFFLTSFHKALYCAILCQVVMLISIIIPNKAVVFCLPIGVFYICNFYITNLIKDSFLNFSRIFDGMTKIFDNDWYGLGYSILVAFIIYWWLYRLTLHFIRKKVHCE